MESGDREPRISQEMSTLKQQQSEEHESDHIVPLIKSPFDGPEATTGEKKSTRYLDELPVYVNEVPWSDLLLEVATTTAFASLTEGTSILEGLNVFSYLSFFALVWWVWSSQVAYNVRFRQSDWLHRLFVFFQLLVFCGLAAFTADFDIASGLPGDSDAETIAEEIQTLASVRQRNLAAPKYRSTRLPTMNARGISMTMALSRLLLLVQYLLAFTHVLRKDGIVNLARRSSFLVHIGSLIFSALCYFVAFAVIGKNPDAGKQIAKLVLWYFPLLVEVASHFIAATLPGRVRYSAEAMMQRSTTLFIIILGNGLDSITEGFQLIVGNVSNVAKSIGLVLVGVIIFAQLFAGYFMSSDRVVAGSRRALGHFFFHYFYLSAIVVTLQGIAAMFKVGVIGDALETPFDFYRETRALIQTKGFGVHLNESDYYTPDRWDMWGRLNQTGMSLTQLLNEINRGINIAKNRSDPELPFHHLIQASAYVIFDVNDHMNAVPDLGSPFYEQFYTLTYSLPRDYEHVNEDSFRIFAAAAIRSNAIPALWFYAAGGAVLIFLAILSLVRHWPRDKYEWGQIFTRLVIGVAVVSLTALDINSSQQQILTDDLRPIGFRIWFLATHYWVLPPYALALLIEQSIELALLYMGARAHNHSVFSPFGHNLRRAIPIPYSPANTTDRTSPYEKDAGVTVNSSDQKRDETPFGPKPSNEKSAQEVPNADVQAKQTLDGESESGGSCV